MSVFTQQSITSAGLALLAKVQTGMTLTFTRVSIGSGYMEVYQTPATMEDLVEPVLTLPIMGMRANKDNTATVSTSFNNSDMVQDFYFREIGLWAQDPDLGEILYSYGNAGNDAELIPAHGSTTVVEKMLDVVTAIGNAAFVMAYIASDVNATKADIEALTALVGNAQGAADAAQETADTAMRNIPALQTDVADLRTRVSDNAARTNTIWNALFTDIIENPFLLEFSDLDAVNVSAGVWNKSLVRLEC